MSTHDLLRRAAQLAEQGKAYALVTVVRVTPPTSAYVGAQALVLADGTLEGWVGGGCAKGAVVSAARAAIGAGEPKLIRISNDDTPAPLGTEVHSMPCASNGSIELFIQPAALGPRLAILGGTPAAAAARDLAHRLDFRVTDEVASDLDFVLVATQGDDDEGTLERALRSDAPRVLMIASRRKAERLKQAMRLRGVPDRRIAQLVSPAGPDIGARTPAEIALAAVAGLVGLHRRATQEPSQAAGKNTGTCLSEAPVPLAERDLSAPYVNPVCGIAVDPAKPKHVVDFEGERFYFCCDGCKLKFDQEPVRFANVQRQMRLRKTKEGVQ